MPKPRLLRSLGLGLILVLACSALMLGGVTGFQPRNIGAWWASMQAIITDREYASGLVESEDVLAYLEANAADMALVSYGVTPEGRPDPDGTGLLFQADQPMPLVGINQILILAAYAEAVVNKDPDFVPTEAVSIAAWEQYYLPNVDNQAHLQSLQDLGLEIGQLGFAVDPEQTTELQSLVRAMVRYGDYAAADYLLFRLGPERVQATADRIGLAEVTPLTPYLGIFLTWRNHETPAQNEARLKTLKSLSNEAYQAQIRSNIKQYQDTTWRSAEIKWRGGAGRVNSLPYEAALTNALLPRGQAGGYAAIMAGIASRTLISAPVSEIMAAYLEWPLAAGAESGTEAGSETGSEAPLQSQFSQLGLKEGGQPGAISLAAYFVPTNGAFAGQPRVVVLFIRNISPAAFLRFRQTLGHQKFIVALANDAEFFEKTAALFAEP